jgi:hypothetical protein
MGEFSWPSTSGGYVVDALQYEQLSYPWVDGVVQAASATSVIYADSTGMRVKARNSKTANIRGHGWSSGDVSFLKTIYSNTSGSARYDVVVLRLTRSTWAVTCEIVKGTAGAGVPAVTQSLSASSVWEIPLAVVTVNSGAITIASGDVLDVAPLVLPSGGVAWRSAVARDYAVVSPAEGMRGYLIDTDSYVVRRSSSWINIHGAWTAYALQWTSTGTQPSIGNGTLAGEYRYSTGTGFYEVRGRMVWGSTTNGGTGQWYLTLPTDASSERCVGPMYILDAGTRERTGIVVTAPADSANRLTPLSSDGGAIGSTTPQTWATGDQMVWSIMYTAI